MFTTIRPCLFRRRAKIWGHTGEILRGACLYLSKQQGISHPPLMVPHNTSFSSATQEIGSAPIVSTECDLETVSHNVRSLQRTFFGTVGGRGGKPCCVAGPL